MRIAVVGLLLAAVACGTGSGGPAGPCGLAVSVCDRRVTCGQLTASERDACVSAFSDLCGAKLCAAGLTPTATSKTACATELEKATCAEIAARATGVVCPKVVCEKPAPGDASLTSKYYGAATDDDRKACTSNGAADTIGGTVATRIFYGTGITDADVVAETRGLQRYYAPLDLRFHTSTAATSLSLTTLMRGSLNELMAALKAAGIDTSKEPQGAELQKAREVVGNLVFKDLRAFMAQHGGAGTGKVNVVVVGAIAGPDIATILPSVKGIAGLGMSPTLLDVVKESDPLADLYVLFGLNSTFTPTLFVGHTLITSEFDRPDDVIAHEMGHALGLVHAQDPTNFMTPGAESGCKPVVTASQARAMKDTKEVALGNDESVLHTIPAVLDALIARCITD